ncbi:MAG TPA: hypothetical protein VD993_04190 [Chitinophagaceae bacterium]|nr:hypothetical protein [Chitinophagaceae bacterium]
MNRKLIMCLIVCALALSVRAQDEEEETKKGFDKEKLFFGGNFGLGFGSNQTNINVSPQVGYRFNDYFAAGTGINFIYVSYKYEWLLPSYKENFGVAGLNIFGRVYPIRFIFAQIQPELNYVWGKRKYDSGEEFKLDSKFVPSLLAGAGAAIPMGGRGAMLVMVQYDILQRPLNPYGKNAFLSIGFNF